MGDLSLPVARVCGSSLHPTLDLILETSSTVFSELETFSQAECTCLPSTQMEKIKAIPVPQKSPRASVQSFPCHGKHDPNF